MAGPEKCADGHGRIEKGRPRSLFRRSGDAGVHALGQVMHIRVSSAVRQTPDVIKRRLNELLPANIVILQIKRAPRNFHARHDALTRTYVYQISRRKQAFMKKYVWWVKEDLDLPAMAHAAAALVGRHDFTCCTDNEKNVGNGRGFVSCR